MKAFQGMKFKEDVLSTDGISIEDMQLSKEFTFRTFDCGGQVNFLPTNQLFITQNAVRFLLLLFVCCLISLFLCFPPEDQFWAPNLQFYFYSLLFFDHFLFLLCDGLID